jgi:uncharacterized protein
VPATDQRPTRRTVFRIARETAAGLTTGLQATNPHPYFQQSQGFARAGSRLKLSVSPARLGLRCARWLPRSLRGIFASMSTHSLTRDEAIQRLQAIEAEIRHLGVRRLALFGSVLRDEARAHSDVDVLVEFIPDEKSFDRFMALADLLEEVLERRVEIVTTEALSPYIGPHILAEARDVLRAA